jgi:UDP-GlcNAc:undecaprenyl-phosphate/decaprenyl-phosphate GlcNAc-1-phosphate transferase
LVAFLVCFFGTRSLISYLTRKGSTVLDYHKINKPQVPRPGGPALIAGIVGGEAILFALTGSYAVLGLLLVTLLSGLVGVVDDYRTLSGVAKPAILIVGGLPLIAIQYLIPNAQVFNTHFYLPLFSTPTNIPLMYPLLVIIAIPVTTNTINTIDVLNGVASGFTLIALIPVAFTISLRVFLGKSDPVVLAALVPVFAATVAFYYFHRYPSKIFPGDSGSLALGGAYGAIAIIGGAEVAAVVAILPAIMNSFFFLSSVRRLVEHRQIRVRPTILLPDARVEASKDERAPVTLMRMLVADGPLSEEQIAGKIFRLVTFTSILAGITAILTWVVVIGK